MKQKKIFSFSYKHVAKNRRFLSGNLKARTRLENMKSQECYETSSENFLKSPTPNFFQHFQNPLTHPPLPPHKYITF